MSDGPVVADRRGGHRARTIFFGSGPFAVEILERLRSLPGIHVVAVVGPPDRPAGRRARPVAVPVVARARALGLPLLQPGRVRDPDAAASIAALRPDLGVLADFGQIIPRTILDIPAAGILNVHPSLLPRHRGATPIPATILAGDPMAGVTVIRMDAGMDTGPIVGQRSWPITATETGPGLETRAAAEGAELLATVLDPYLDGRLPAQRQPEAGATLTRPLRREDGRLGGDVPAFVLERRVRAYQPWPGTFLEVPAGRLAVLRAAVEPGRAGDEPGTLMEDGDGIALATVRDRLALLEVRPSGGRAMTAAAYRRGHPSVVGAAREARA